MPSLPPLPGSIYSAIQRARIDPSTITLLQHLPKVITLHMELPLVGPIRPGAAVLLKACLRSPWLLLDAPKIDPRCTDSRVVFETDGRVAALHHEELDLPLARMLDVILPQLYTASEIAEIYRRLAFIASTNDTIHQLTTQMLTTSDQDRALSVMLSGITTGFCLSFNRAVLFRYDKETHELVGYNAVGPNDEREAARVWREIEAEDITVETLIRQEISSETPLARRVRDIRIPLPCHDDAISLALQLNDVIHVCNGGITHPELAKLGSNGEFVVAPLQAHGQLLGLLYADDFFLNAPIDQLRIEQLKFFVEQTALIWENLSLLQLKIALASRDPLTGTFNRREFDSHLNRAIEAGENFALLMLDIDRFKEINDRRGHAQGDWTLRGLSKVAITLLRCEDIFARFGGDEFAVILKNADAATAQTVAQRLLEQVHERLGITLSIGCGLFPNDGKSYKTLFESTDRRLYIAKEQGRNRYIGPIEEAQHNAQTNIEEAQHNAQTNEAT